MIPFYSKRNQVYASLYDGRAAVEKHFFSLDDWRRETALYKALSGRLPLPEVLLSKPGLLVTAYCPYPTLLAVLEEQEKAGFSVAPWQALADWIQRCHAFCGELPTDGNLRNFLWDREARRVIGLDLEGYQPCDIKSFGAELIAVLLSYAPSDTLVKQKTADLLAVTLDIPSAAIERARQRLQQRRDGHSSKPISGIILAGGRSRRMGRNKADMILDGKTFLHWQVEKLQALGIQDIMLSGANCPELPGTKRIRDQYPDRGPLGGLHACLGAAQHPRVLVVTTDTPLIPAGALAHLCRAHSAGITALRHGDKAEPLIAIYDSNIAQIIQPAIEHGSAPVCMLKEKVPWRCFDCMGPEALFLNCNTPEDYTRLISLATAYQAAGLPL